jgi:hypothetical protein
MCRSDNSRAELDSFDEMIAKGHVRQGVNERLQAGQVLLEMVHIAATTSEAPSQGKAVRLAAFNQHRRASPGGAR